MNKLHNLQTSPAQELNAERIPHTTVPEMELEPLRVYMYYIRTNLRTHIHTYLFFRLQSFPQGKPKCKDADSIAAEKFRMEIFRKDADPIAAEDIGMEIFCKVADSINAEDFRVEINFSVCQLPSSSSL